MDNFTHFRISDAGPKEKVMVYQQLTGTVVWRQPWWMPYGWALKKAKKEMEKWMGNN